MQYHEMYAELLGKQYDDGNVDCYGLARLYYAKNYDIELPNYARSALFMEEGLDLIGQLISEQEFVVTDVSTDKLEPGDALILCVPMPHRKERTANHIGVFVGNGTFIHHLYGKKSEEAYLTPQWSARIMAVLRHASVHEANARRLSASPTNFLDLLPDHVKRRFV